MPDQPGRTSFVLVHGVRTSATMWRAQREFLEPLGFEVATPDLPGHGTRIGERFSLAGAMNAIDSALAPGGTAVLVGFSLGGYLSIRYAASRSGRVRGLVAASCGTEPYRLLLAGYRMVAAAVHALPDRGARLNERMVRASVRDPQGVRDVLAGGVALEVMGDVLRELRMLDVRGCLRRIQAPVWFVNGSRDHFRLQERRMLAATRNGRLVRIPRANHMVSFARPDLFNQVLVEALDTLAPR